MEKLSNKCPCNTPDCPHGGQCDYGCEKYVEWMTQMRASLAAYEDTELSPEEIERILDAYGRGMTLRTESGQRLEIIRDIPTSRLRELVRADWEVKKEQYMTEIEQHIQTLNVMQAQYSHIRRSEAEWQAVEAAKDALREKQEREKGCEFCKIELEDYPYINACGDCDSSDTIYTPEFCPICGCPLTEK